MSPLAENHGLLVPSGSFVGESSPSPKYAASRTCCRSTTYARAWRAFTLLNGGEVVSTSQDGHWLGVFGKTIEILSLFLYCATLLRGSAHKISRLPDASELDAEAASLVATILIWSRGAGPPKYLSLRTRVR